MTTPFSEDLISAYLDGELAAEERARVEEKLRSDADLQHLAEELRALKATLQSMPVASPPEDFSERVLRQAERRMLTGSDESDSAGGGSRPVASERGEATTGERQPSRRRYWRFALPLIATVAALLLVAAFLFDVPVSFRVQSRVAQGVDGEAAGRGTAADRGESTRKDVASAETVASAKTTAGRRNSEATLESRALEKEPPPLAERGLSQRGGDAPVNDRAAAVDEERSAKKAASRARTHASPAADAYGSEDEETLSERRGQRDESRGKPSATIKGLAVPGSGGLSTAESAASRPDKPHGPGDSARAAGEQPSVEHPNVERRKMERPRKPAKRALDTSHFGLGMGGMGGGNKGKLGDSAAPPDLGTRAHLGREPLEGGEPAASGTNGGSPVPTARELAERLENNQSLLVQVSLSPEARVELAKTKRKDAKKGHTWGGIAHRLLGAEHDGPTTLKVSAARAKKLPASSAGYHQDASFGYSGGSSEGHVVLVEGTKESLRGSLANLVSRTDVRINRVSTASPQTLDAMRRWFGLADANRPPRGRPADDAPTVTADSKRAETKTEPARHTHAPADVLAEDQLQASSDDGGVEEQDVRELDRDTAAGARASAESAPAQPSSSAKNRRVERLRGGGTRGAKDAVGGKPAQESGGEEELEAEKVGEQKEEVAQSTDGSDGKAAAAATVREELSSAASGVKADRKQKPPRWQQTEPPGSAAGVAGQRVESESESASKYEAPGKAWKESAEEERVGASKSPEREMTLYFLFHRISDSPGEATLKPPSGPTSVVDPPVQSEESRE